MKFRFIKTGNQRGFSLVELVASLVIAGILAVALTTIVVTAMDGYVFSQNSADVSQKGQLALARMRSELLNATAVSTATASKIVFTNPDGTYELEKTGDLITLTAHQLTGCSPKNTGGQHPCQLWNRSIVYLSESTVVRLLDCGREHRPAVCHRHHP